MKTKNGIKLYTFTGVEDDSLKIFVRCFIELKNDGTFANCCINRKCKM